MDRPTREQFLKSSKHSVTLPVAVYAALKKAAAEEGLEPYEKIQELVVNYVISKRALDPSIQKKIETGRALIAQAVDIAKKISSEESFSRSITLDTFRACVKDEAWAKAYREYIEDDIYKHGNPLKSINREIGFRIRAAIGGEVETGPDGKAVVAKVSGEVIQSYTPMKSYRQ